MGFRRYVPATVLLQYLCDHCEKGSCAEDLQSLCDRYERDAHYR